MSDLVSFPNVATKDDTTYPYIFEKNVTVPLTNGAVIRCNVYRPKASDQGKKYPVIATYGPYGKDVHYKYFNPISFADVNPDHQEHHSSWETPSPKYWTENGFIVVRGDEVGTGQSPGYLNPLSATTIDTFCDFIEWASEQEWSTGKVGLLGISYFGATQWQVAARRPKGLTAIVPWEGFSDLYRDASRHGGIQSSGGLDLVWKRQIASNQYGLPGRQARNWGDDTIEGSLAVPELSANSVPGLVESLRKHKFRDDPPFAGVNFNLEDIQVPVLSVANWGGILLHLRGNVEGYIHAGSEFKYLRFIVGRHDLPFYDTEEVEIQRSFLDAFLKGQDAFGWSRKGALPPVDLILRKGNVGYNDPKAESAFLRRPENEWPIARTEYTDLHLNSNKSLTWNTPADLFPGKVEYEAFPQNGSSSSVSFMSAPFESGTEITGHIVAHLNISTRREHYGTLPTDIDLFLSLRHISASGEEIFYTGTQGEAAPVTKGFLRVSLRKTDPSHPRHRAWLPHRNYYSTDVLPVIPGDIYGVDVEIWPTNVVVEKGGRLAIDIGSKDLAGSGNFTHNDSVDRPRAVFKGINAIHFGPQYDNYLRLPIIPERR